MPSSVRSLASAAAVVLLAGSCTAQPQPPAGTRTAVQTPAERGKYLVDSGGCGDCHTPMKMGPMGPEPDISRLLSGHPEGLKVTSPPLVNHVPDPITPDELAKTK